MIPARLLGDDGEPLWLLTGAQAARLAAWDELIREKFRRDGLPVDADLDADLVQLRAAAVAHVAWQQTRDASASDWCPSLPAGASNSRPLTYLATGEVAKRLGVHPRTVARACEDGSLRATRAGEGHGFPWWIAEEALAEYQEARGRRDRRAAGAA